MSAYPNHQDIRPAYVTDTDPGAVGAGIFWFQPTAKFLAVRNDANTGWVFLVINLVAGNNINISEEDGIVTISVDPLEVTLKEDIRYPDELNLLIHLAEI